MLLEIYYSLFKDTSSMYRSDNAWINSHSKTLSEMSSKVYFCSLKLVCFPLSLCTLVNPNTHLNPSSTAIRFVISKRKTASLIIPRKLFFSFCICIGLNHKEVNLNANDVRKHKTHIESRIRFGEKLPS